MEYYSAIKKNTRMPFAAVWMDPEIIILSQTEKCKYHTTSLICGISNRTQMNLSMKQTDIENRLVVAKGEGLGRGMGWEVEVSR